jgi:SAM-dependent methyltransferase
MTQHRYTHGHADAVLRSHNNRTAANSAAYLLPELVAGQRLLDIGSGPGTITADLASLVAPGRVVAVEISAPAVAVTRSGLDRAGVDNVECLVGDVHALDFADDCFDVVHAHQVLQHVADPVAALREMARVCRPGGVIAARDSDYRGFTWYPEVPALDRWMSLYQRAARANGGEPDAGRRLLSWARAAGLSDVRVIGSVWTYADPAARGWWGDMWADRILESDLTRQVLAEGWATRAELEEISAGWRAWRDSPDGFFMIPHGELLARV